MHLVLLRGNTWILRIDLPLETALLQAVEPAALSRRGLIHLENVK
jgi:hypothetical protein